MDRQFTAQFISSPLPAELATPAAGTLKCVFDRPVHSVLISTGGMPQLSTIGSPVSCTPKCRNPVPRPAKPSCSRFRAVAAHCLRAGYIAEHGDVPADYVAENWKREQQTGLFLGEDEARFFFRQFITAVAFCHAHSVAHRWARPFHCTAMPSFRRRHEKRSAGNAQWLLGLLNSSKTGFHLHSPAAGRTPCPA